MNNKKKDPFEISSIKKITFVLFDGKKHSAYQIAKEVGVSISTVIEHLNRLNKYSYVKIYQANKGKIIRKHYSLTDHGKNRFIHFLKKEIDSINQFYANH